MLLYQLHIGLFLHWRKYTYAFPSLQFSPRLSKEKMYIYIYIHTHTYYNQLFFMSTITFGNKFKSDKLYSSFKICDILIYFLKSFEIKEKHLKTSPGESLRDIKMVAFNGLLQT